jgi:succinate-acetate transporter protein
MLVHRAVFTRLVWIATTINWAAWAIFVIFTPTLTVVAFGDIAAKRAAVDAGGPLELITDVPTVLAARWFGGFTPLNWDALLYETAAPFVYLAEMNVVPPAYIGTSPTRSESYVIATIAFIVSTAFWASVGGLLTLLWSHVKRAKQPTAALEKRGTRVN